MEQRQLIIPADGVELIGDLGGLGHAVGLVIFAHGSGSSRHSQRNQAVARDLQNAGFATLLFDLLTEAEERVDQRTRELRFDIDLLARRLTATVDWVVGQGAAWGGGIGLFGASTGAAAALIAAADRPDAVKAVVSRGGRPDLAGGALGRVEAPTLLIVGGRDEPVIDLNHEAAASLSAPHETVIVPGATHLFEEPGKLDEVARLTAAWFRRYLPEHQPSEAPSGPRD